MGGPSKGAGSREMAIDPPPPTFTPLAHICFKLWMTVCPFLSTFQTIFLDQTSRNAKLLCMEHIRELSLVGKGELYLV